MFLPWPHSFVNQRAELDGSKVNPWQVVCHRLNFLTRRGLSPHLADPHPCLVGEACKTKP